MWVDVGLLQLKVGCCGVQGSYVCVCVGWMLSRVDAGCVQTTTGATPLYIACEKGDQAEAEVLLDRGADVNQARVRYGGGEGLVV